MPLPYSNDCAVQPAELIYSLNLLGESPITSREIRLQVVLSVFQTTSHPSLRGL